MLLQGPSCRQLCLVPDVDTTPAQRKRWPQIVEAVAQLLACRLRVQPKSSKERLGPMLWKGRNQTTCLREDQCYFQFSYKEGIRKGPQAMAIYSESLVHDEPLGCHSQTFRKDAHGQVYPTLIETYLSFVLTHEGKRWETGQGADQNGHWISNQLVQFKIALKSFQTLAESDCLIPSPPIKELPGGWLQRAWLPKADLCGDSYISPELARSPQIAHKCTRPTLHSPTGVAFSGEVETVGDW